MPATLIKRYLLVVSAIFTFHSFVFADNLTGRVLDPQGKAVINAQLRLFERNSGELRKAVSNEFGNYSIQGVPAGDYLLEGDASDAALTASRTVSLHGDQKLDLELKIANTNIEVLVTASGTPQTIEEVAKAIDVVDSEEIALRDEISIGAAVRTLPGIRVQTLEGPGSFTTIRTRGLRNQDTALLIDGMRFRDASSIGGDGTGFLQDMSIVDTERIEFLRGSGSSLYGSNALGGVINITSRPGGGATHGEFLAEGGGLGFVRSVAGIGGGLASDRFTYSGSVSHQNLTKGVRNGSPYRNTSVQGSAKFSFSPQVSASGKLWFADSYAASTESSYVPASLKANSPSSGPVQAIPLPLDQLALFENHQPYNPGNATYMPNQMDPDARRLGRFLNGSLLLQHQVSATTSYRVAYQGVNTKRSFLDGPAGVGQFGEFSQRNNLDGRVDTLQAKMNSRAGSHNLITFGYEFETEQYFSFNGADRTTNAIDLRQRSNAFYAQDQIHLLGNQLQFTFAARAQTFSLQPPTFAGATTTPYSGVSTVTPPTAYTGDGSVAYFAPQTRTKFRAHIGNSFRAPSGYERFGGGFGSYYGDPRLSPDRSVALDGGMDQWFFRSKLQLTGTIFYTNLQQIITFVNSFAPGSDPFGRTFGGYANAGGGIARGLEFSGKVSPTSRTTVQASYTYTNSDSRKPTIPGTTYYKVLGVSPHTFTLTATQWIGDHVNVAFDMSALSDYSMTLSGGGARQFIFNGPVKGDIAVRYNHPMTDKRSIEFYTKVENVLNQRPYENGFIGPKAWAIAGLRLKY